MNIELSEREHKIIQLTFVHLLDYCYLNGDISDFSRKEIRDLQFKLWAQSQKDVVSRGDK